jgi:hypothetical protein
MPYYLVIKKNLILKKTLQIIIILFLAIFSNQAISQENIVNNIVETPTQPKIKPSPKNKTPSPILKNPVLKDTNKNSNNSIKTSAPSPTTNNPKNNDPNIKSSNPNLDLKPVANINSNNNLAQNSQNSNKNSANNSTTNSNSANSNPANISSSNSTTNNSTTTNSTSTNSITTNSTTTNSNNSNSNTPNPTNANKSSTQSSSNNILANDQVTKNSALNPEVNKKTPVTNSKNSAKNIFNKNQKNSKKNIKKPKKNIKNTPPKIDKIVNPEPENKKYINENGRKINGDYFLQIISKKSCDIVTQTECFRRDRKNEEPYFHKTIISIFNNRIVAEQYFTTTNNNKKIFLKVNNGNYQLTTTNDNLISFTVLDGIVRDLILVSGNISRENFIVSKCVIAEKNYGYLMAYNKQPKLVETNYFSNKDNFEGVRNLVIFSNIENIDNLTLQDLMAIEVKSYNNIYAIENLNLCKKPNSDILEVREISKAECKKRQECLILINSNPDFQNKIIDESCLGYFDSKRQDFQSCSTSPECNDYAVIKDCEVKLMAGE